MDLRRLADEARREARRELDGLSEAAYNRLADGGRAKPRPRKMTVEEIATMRRALGLAG